MNDATRVKKYLEFLKTNSGKDLFIPETHVKKSLPITLEDTGISYFYVLIGGNVESALDIDELTAYLENSEEIKTLLTPVKPGPKVVTQFKLTSTNIMMVSHDTYDTLITLFPPTVYDLAYGITVQLRDLLPSFRTYNNNEELRKKDLSEWLMNTGLFSKTPSNLYTYVNSVPLSRLETTSINGDFQNLLTETDVQPKLSLDDFSELIEDEDGDTDPDYDNDDTYDGDESDNLDPVIYTPELELQ